MISTGIINALGTILIIYAVPVKHIPIAVIVTAILGMIAGIIEISVSYRSKEEKTRDIATIVATSFAEAAMAKTFIEKFINEMELNTGNTIMKELVTSMLNAPAGTEFLIQILILIGIAVIIAGIIKCIKF